MGQKEEHLEFVDPGVLRDADLELDLVERFPGDPAIGFVPAYRFQMLTLPRREPVGNIELRVGNTSHILLYGGHLAFNVEEAHRGRRYATRSARLQIDRVRGRKIR